MSFEKRPDFCKETDLQCIHSKGLEEDAFICPQPQRRVAIQQVDGEDLTALMKDDYWEASINLAQSQQKGEAAVNSCEMAAAVRK